MKFEYTEVWGFKHAIRGMRNPHESWDKSDSIFRYAVPKVSDGKSFPDAIPAEFIDCCKLGENDLRLMQSLIKAGSEHRKFMRQIFVSVDITAPLYWWKEADQYKIGTVSDSCSTMHKLASTPITRDCFEMDDYESAQLHHYPGVGTFEVGGIWHIVIETCEKLRLAYNATKDKCYWKELIRLLPESWLQKRTVTMNYENVLSMVRQRKNHKLTEWSEKFIEWARTLPYADELLFI